MQKNVTRKTSDSVGKTDAAIGTINGLLMSVINKRSFYENEESDPDVLHQHLDDVMNQCSKIGLDKLNINSITCKEKRILESVNEVLATAHPATISELEEIINIIKNIQAKRKNFKTYIAGKVNPNSSFTPKGWRDELCNELSNLTQFKIQSLDPTKSAEGFELKEDNPYFIFGRDSFMIKKSDFVIVNLTDDISVGGSQEMLIAKYFHKPLIGIAPKEGKFNKSIKEINGKIYKNYINPFVFTTCDFIVETVHELANAILNIINCESANLKIKDISLINDAYDYYLDNFYKQDEYLH